MELSPLPLMLLLIAGILSGHAEEKPKAKVILHPDKDKPTAAKCEIPGADDDWKYSWFKDGSTKPFGIDRVFSISTGASHSMSKVTCSGQRNSDGLESEISDAVILDLPFHIESHKAVLTVQHEPSQIHRGDSVTLTCDIQGDDWTYLFNCGNKEHKSEKKEFNIIVESTQTCKCIGWRQSGTSEWSNEVNLTVSETPKAVLTVQPELPQIFRGDTVILTCDVQGEDWKYRFKCGDKAHDSEEKELKITVEFTQTCRCSSLRQSGSTGWSNEVTVTVFDMDKPKISIKPQSSVFTGDTVTLSCDAGRSTAQRIIWYKDSSKIEARDKTKTLTDVKISDGGMYKCAVVGANNATKQGPAVGLTVTEKPKAAVHVLANGDVFRGQTVTFTCHIPISNVTRWSYSWNKDDSVIQDSESQEYRISSVDESHAGLYSCRGRETGGSRLTHTSDQHTLNVSERPKAVLTVQSELSQILRGDTVTLTCDVQGEDWKYKLKCGDKELDSEEKEFRISVESTQTCKCHGWRQSSGSSKRSNEVTLTVLVHTESHKAVLTVQPEPSQILRGDTVTLKCDIQGEDWEYLFDCGDNEHKSEEKEFNITVESTQKCKCHGWRQSSGSSEWSNEVTLTVLDPPADHTRLIALSAGLGALVLLCFILLLLWCCKRKKDVGSLSLSADHQQHNISQTPEEEKRKKQTLRSDSVNDSSDVTYAQIEMKTNVETKKKNKDDKENSRETPDTVYSKLKI